MRADTSRGRNQTIVASLPASAFLDLGHRNPDYRVIAKCARTSPEMIAKVYDQTHPETLLEQAMGLRYGSGAGRGTRS